MGGWPLPGVARRAQPPCLARTSALVQCRLDTTDRERCRPGLARAERRMGRTAPLYEAGSAWLGQRYCGTVSLRACHGRSEGRPVSHQFEAHLTPDYFGRALQSQQRDIAILGIEQTADLASARTHALRKTLAHRCCAFIACSVCQASTSLMATAWNASRVPSASRIPSRVENPSMLRGGLVVATWPPIGRTLVCAGAPMPCHHPASCAFS